MILSLKPDLKPRNSPHQELALLVIVVTDPLLYQILQKRLKKTKDMLCLSNLTS